MADKKISQLNITTTADDGSWLVMNDSGNTATFRITRQDLLSGTTQPPGLVAGTGTDSIKSNLTATPATASGQESIAIGKNARATSTNSIMIGTSENNSSGSVGIGHNLNGIGTFSVEIGRDLYASGSDFVIIGRDGNVGNRSVMVGNASRANGTDCITIGNSNPWNAGTRNVVIGKNITHINMTGTDNISIGSNHSMANVSGSRNTILGGYGNTITGATSNVVVLGLSGFTPTENNTTYVDNIKVISNLILADYANLDFADDTAAAAGGVSLGGVYHTSGALKVRVT